MNSNYQLTPSKMIAQKISLLILLFLLAGSSSIIAQKTKKKITSSLNVETLAGQKVALKDYIDKESKITVVNFWATWCKPCKEELDNIQAEYLEDWKEKYDIKFVAVSMDNPRTKPKVKGVVDTKGWEYDILCNPDNSAYQMLGFNSCPYTLLVNEDGNIVYKHTGYKPGDEEELEQAIANAFETKKAAEETVKPAADEARKADKIAQEKALVLELEKMAESIKAYQAFINDEEKGEAFNKELNKLLKSIKTTIKTSK